MEFFVVVLIFISCMIALALLIYYCQEKRNPKYNFTSNQKAISAIALSVGMPMSPSDIFHPSPYAPTIVSYPPRPPPPGFVMAPLPVDDDELSDSGSSSSSKIYFAPHTAAYSVAKRMSIKTKMERKMSAKPQPAYINTDTAAYILAANKKENQYYKAVNPSDVTPIHSRRSNIETIPSSDSISRLGNLSNVTPIHSRRSNIETIPSSDSDSRLGRSVSPYIPASVVAFHMRNKSRSESPYTPLKNEAPSALPHDSANASFERSESPSPPSQRCSPMRSESLPPKKSVSQKPSEILSKRSGSLPPNQSEILPLRQTESSERFPFAYSEGEYQSRSSIPLQQLHTLHEEHSE